MSNRTGVPVARHGLASACAALLLAVVGVTPAQAVDVSDPTNFQLDANAQDSNGVATAPDDWDSVFGLFGVTGGVVRLADDRRYDLPVTMVCPEFSPAEAKEWAVNGRRQRPPGHDEREAVFALPSWWWVVCRLPGRRRAVLP